MTGSQSYNFPAHDNWIKATTIENLPVKKVVDHKSLQVVESLTYSRDLKLDGSPPGDAFLKVKMMGINFRKDFELLKDHNHNPGYDVVPGNKIIGKIHLVSRTSRLVNKDRHGKFIVFPYSTCHQQSAHPCMNCQRISRKNLTLTKHTYSLFKDYECQKRYEYGYNIDGGLQDYIKIHDPSNTLIKIPENVSLHDCCFMMDIMLPLYLFLYDNHNVNPEYSEAKIELSGNSLVILSDAVREGNDVLLVLRFFAIDESEVIILDRRAVVQMPNDELSMLQSLFTNVFVFDIDKTTLSFALHCCLDEGSEGQIVLFDQYVAKHYALEKLVQHSIQVHHVRNSYKDKIHAEELVSFMAKINKAYKRPNPPGKAQNDSPSQLTNALPSSETVRSILSGNTSSLFSSENCPSPASSASVSPRTEVLDKFVKKPSFYSWLWYDGDYKLGLGDVRSWNNSTFDDEKVHGVPQINFLMDNKSIERLCYTSESLKELNALVI